MPPSVVMGAKIMCSFGTGPGTLIAIPKGPPVMMENKIAATVMDHLPFANILPAWERCRCPLPGRASR
jgi:hypothetical protein